MIASDRLTPDQHYLIHQGSWLVLDYQRAQYAADIEDALAQLQFIRDSDVTKAACAAIRNAQAEHARRNSNGSGAGR